MDSKQVFWIAVVTIVSVALCWSIFGLAMNKKPEVIARSLSDGQTLRMVTVEMIIILIGILALAGKFSGEVSTAIAGIAGYILGSAQRQPKQREQHKDFDAPV